MKKSKDRAIVFPQFFKTKQYLHVALKTVADSSLSKEEFPKYLSKNCHGEVSWCKV